MKFYITYNLETLDDALAVARQTASYADGIIIGPLLLYHYGIKVVEAFQHEFPHHQVIIDAKICDRAQEAMTLMLQTGIAGITVLAGASRETIYAASKAAHQYKAHLFLDLLDAYSMGQSALEAEQLGIDAIIFHRAHEHADAAHLLNEWEETHGNTHVPIFIDGNVSRSTIDQVLALKPHGVIIGSAITGSETPAHEAAFFRSRIAPKKPE